MQKALSFLVAFFAVLLLREKQKKPFVSPTFFAYITSPKQRENQPKTKIHRNVFLSIILFEAHIPKIGQIGAKIKNGPKFDIG